MAREEEDREDLLAEATALVERVEFSIDSQSDSLFAASLATRGTPIDAVVAGFRRDGSLSIFFGGDPVYQFNARGELRRAFVDGLLYKAVHGKLASLRRVRTADETQLVRHDLTTAETRRLLDQLQECLQTLTASLEVGKHRVLRQIPVERDVIGRIRQWLEQRGEQISIASTPRAG